MKFVSCRQMREMDRTTIERHNTPGQVLMERAGRAVAETVLEIALSRRPNPPVRFLAGRGNNGGDAFAAAAALQTRGMETAVWLVSGRNDIRGDARVHFESLAERAVPVRELADDPSAWQNASRETEQRPGILVDGVLGTGISGTVHGPAARAIAFLNEHRPRNFVVSIDVPSGLNADTGTPCGEAVRADLTVTLAFPKLGFTFPGALSFLGAVEVVDIGIPPLLAAGMPSDLELIAAAELCTQIPLRARDAHKGAFGHVLIVAGARGYVGASVLAASAALRSGAGLVTLLVPAGIAGNAASMLPEAMVHPGLETPAGHLAANALNRWNLNLNAFTAILVGPGLTANPDTRTLVRNCVAECEFPLVLDADALNVCAGELDCLSQRANAPLVLTPHPGEMARLLGRRIADVQIDRIAAVRSAADQADAVTVLKGAGTLITAPRSGVFLNLTGNPGMAKAGMGDVLAGLLTGLLAQGMPTLEAAKLAVYVHGKAGDLAARIRSQTGMIASDVIDALPETFRRLLSR